jgi:hypothetical protein
VFKWYRPGSGTHSPDAIADHFIVLLEAGYLAEKGTAASAAAGRGGVRGSSEKPLSGDEAARELRRQSAALADLADRIEGGQRSAVSNQP